MKNQLESIPAKIDSGWNREGDDNVQTQKN